MSRVRSFKTSDTDVVVDLAIRAWAPVFDSFRAVLGEEIYDRYYPDWESQQRDSVREALTNHPTWVSVDGENVTGFVNVTFDGEELIGDIYMIAVDPRYQRQGYAGELTAFAIDEMRRRGMTLATVSTGGDPGHAPARFTYEKAGFTPFPQVIYSKIIEPG